MPERISSMRQDFAMVCHALAGTLENPPDAVESLKAEMKILGPVLIAA